MRILIVDDEKNIRESIAEFLKLEGIESREAADGREAQKLLGDLVFSAAVIDLKMPLMSGQELLNWISERGLRLPVIMISAHGEIQDAVEAMKSGAEDYLVKPFEPEELVIRIKSIIEKQNLKDVVELGKRGEAELGNFIGRSQVVLKLKEDIKKIALTPSTVLITGESGTGKEVLARAIHSLSARKEQSFVPVNVGGIPDTLLESELFGFEKGAFTGAVNRKQGLFEIASGGTIFLDEIGEMPPALQVKLLRVLQDRKIRRLGGVEDIPVDTRIISATNADLDARVSQGSFRQDLYYRINVVSLSVPPLRERREDIPLLVGYFINSLNQKMGRSVKTIDPQALRVLLFYDFPGNIRELENIIERAFIFTEDHVLSVRQLNLPDIPELKSDSGTLKELEKVAIIQALSRWRGNKTRAAEELGITRRTLFNKIQEHGLE